MRFTRYFGVVVVLGMVLAQEAGSAEQWAGTCVEVVDGDTVVVERAGGRVLLNLWGVDAPEIGQPFGSEAQQHLRELVLGNKVVVQPQVEIEEQAGEGMPAIVRMGDLDLRRELVAAGLAWHDTANNDEEELVLEMIMARSARTGLWAADDPTSPAKWRQQHSPEVEAQTKEKRLADVADNVEFQGEVADDDGVIRLARDVPSEDAETTAGSSREGAAESADPCIQTVSRRAEPYAKKKGCETIYDMQTPVKGNRDYYTVQGTCLDAETLDVRTFEVLFMCRFKKIHGQIWVEGSDQPVRSAAESAPMGFEFVD